MIKLKCVIIDDEPVARRLLAEFIGDIPFLELAGQAENPSKAIALLNDHPVDIIFLDINMPKVNGIDFLKNSKNTASIIMTTAYSEYAVEAFSLDVLDYLVKPIPFERFLKACNKALEIHHLKGALESKAALESKVASDLKAMAESKEGAHSHETPEDYFFIKCDNQIEKVLFSDLLYAESKLNYVMLHTTQRKMIVYITLKSLEEQLPAEHFIKVHKSFLVNRHKIKSIEGNLLNIGNGKIAISQNLREKVLQEILKDKMIKR